MKYLEWAGAEDAGWFRFYDGEKNQKFEMEQFAVKDIEYTVKGFDEGSNSVIYSNDIKLFNDEEFTVKCGSGTIFKAAEHLRLKAWGVEKDEGAYEIAQLTLTSLSEEEEDADR